MAEPSVPILEDEAASDWAAWAPDSLGEAVHSYEQALSKVLECTRHSALRVSFPSLYSCEALSRTEVLDLLLARDRIARMLTAEEEGDASLLDRVSQLDQRMKDKVRLVIAGVGRLTFRQWRETLRPPDEHWWWRLDEHMAGSQFRAKYAGALIIWILIAISLSYIVDVVRRFLSGGVDVLSTSLQGLIALLVGSTLVQVAWQMVEGSKNPSNVVKVERRKWTRDVLTVVLVALAVTIYLYLPRVSKFYSDRCANYLLDFNQSSAIYNCQRAVSLQPENARAHWVLGKVYESVFSYDKAHAEFEASILQDDKLCRAYSDLAYSYLVRRNDPTNALKLLNNGLIKCQSRAEQDPPLTEEELRKTMYSLLKNRAWAHMATGALFLAEQDVNAALGLNDIGAEAFCLRAQIVEKKNGATDLKPPRLPPAVAKAVSEDWKTCVDYNLAPIDQRGDKDEVHVSLISLARERSQTAATYRLQGER
jgi:hypothetical protein